MTPITIKKYCLQLFLLLSLLVSTSIIYAEEVPEKKDDLNPTLTSLLHLHDRLSADIAIEKKRLKKQLSPAEKKELQTHIDGLEQELKSVDKNIANVIAGTDISVLYHPEPKEFSFQKEFFELLKPALDEMKAMTVDVRKKTDLRKKIARLNKQLPIISKALENLDNVLAKSADDSTKDTLTKIASKWRKYESLKKTELQTAQLQLDKMLAEEVSITDASQDYLKSFFRQRGLYLLEAIVVVVGIGIIARIIYAIMRRIIPGFDRQHRSFRVRLTELVFYLLTILLMILGPIIVFYIVEDWVLLSLGILILIGVALTLRHAIPRYIHQIELFLNIGSVREGERILLDGLPWQVSSINVYCTLDNPDAGLSQRIHIDDLVDQKSRQSAQHEPWFPCRRDEWVILSDGTRGKATGISLEMVELTERGGARVNYQMKDFLAGSPRNLSHGFRLKELLGISYDQQSQCTQQLPQTLAEYIHKQLLAAGYEESLLSIKAEFAQINQSSLDLVVIADFNGEVAELYGRLRRFLQRLCVDACSEYGWEIPFPQMVIHKTASK